MLMAGGMGWCCGSRSPRGALVERARSGFAPVQAGVVGAVRAESEPECEGGIGEVARVPGKERLDGGALSDAPPPP